MRRSSCLAAAVLAVTACASTVEPEDGVRIAVRNVVIAPDSTGRGDRFLLYDWQLTNVGQRRVHLPGCADIDGSNANPFGVTMVIASGDSIVDASGRLCAGGRAQTTPLTPGASLRGAGIGVIRLPGARYTPVVDVAREAGVDRNFRRVRGDSFVAP
ncbi:MAG: hypothetical protein MUE41_18260 [Gemmatimonadaceae bacterium]|jgi:hypothetical protein|nr:hypothetical protein [Gemmatimonadaceae bacterium]